MGRKKKPIKVIDPNTPICCICKKYIMKKIKLVRIGKNFVNLELFRHEGCYLHNMTDCEVKKLKTVTEINLKQKKKKKL